MIDGGWVRISGTTGFDYTTMAMLTCGLVDPRMKIEIEVYARQPTA